MTPQRLILQCFKMLISRSFRGLCPLDPSQDCPLVLSASNHIPVSPLKPLGQMNQNLVGSIYGMSSVKTTHFVPIR